MSELNPILTQVLSADRPVQQRLSLLETIRDELKDEASIHALLAAAREEKTLQLRSAFLKIALKADITRISDRGRYIDALLHFAAAEEDIQLRRACLVCIGKLAAHDPRIEEVLLESLCCDFDTEIQLCCLDGLSNCVSKNPATIKRLLEFARVSPAPIRKDLIAFFAKLQSEDAQTGLCIFLHPSEDAGNRRAALKRLGELPLLLPATTELIGKMVANDPSAQLQQLAVEVLRDYKQLDPELFKTVFSLLAKFPNRSDLLEAVRHRLASFPELLGMLPELFASTHSAQLRLRILDMLKDTAAIDLYVVALYDPKWQVRRMAIERCKQYYADHAEKVGLALAEASIAENIVTLRESLARAFPERARRNAAIDRELIQWFERETEPRVQAALVLTLRSIPANGEHRETLLRAYRKILSEPFCDQNLRGIILNELGNFHVETDASFVADLKAQLRRCRTIEEAETLYASLRSAESNPGAHADLLLELFYRFIGDYPREPLRKWVQDFKALAAHDESVRREIPYIVKVTGESWILGAADSTAQKSALLSALQEQIRQDRTIEAVRLLEEAYNNRTLRKSDCVAFFKSLLNVRNAESVMNKVMVLMARGGLVTPEILEIAFAYLEQNPRDGTYTSIMADFVQGKDQDHTPRRSIDEKRPDLETARKQDPEYRKRIFAAFSQEGLLNYWGDLPEEFNTPFEAKDTNDWEYQKWARTAEDWPIARLFFELQPYDRIVEILSQPPDPLVSSQRSIQFMLLRKLWTEPDAKFPDQMALFSAIGTLFHNTRNSAAHRLLNDRAVLVFYLLWDRRISRADGLPQISAELAKTAAEIYAAVCKRKSEFYGSEKKFPEVIPDFLIGLDLEHLKSIWPFDAESWNALSKARLDTLADEMKARQMHAQAMNVEYEGRFEELYNLYGELLKLINTPYVKTRYSIFSYRKDDYDPSKQPTESDEANAKMKYDLIIKQIEGKDTPSRITHAISYLLGKLWRTKFLTEKRAELIALRKQFSANTKAD